MSSFIEDVVFQDLVVTGVTPGVALTQMAYVVTKLGIPDMLAHAPRTASALAEATGSHPQSLTRVLRTLAAYGLFARNGDEFALSEAGRRLLWEHPRSVRAPLLGQGDSWSVWGALAETVRTGAASFRLAHGVREWEFLAAHPESNRAFTEHMAQLARLKLETVMRVPFPEAGVIVDLGGRDGTMLCALLTQHTDRRGIVVDQQATYHLALEKVEREGLSSRCSVAVGDFFVSVPAGADAYLLSSILHDWSDEDSLRILANVREAMLPSSRLYILEVAIPDALEPSAAHLLDVNMMVVTGGKERTTEEWRGLIRSANLTLASVTHDGAFVVLECTIDR